MNVQERWKVIGRLLRSIKETAEENLRDKGIFRYLNDKGCRRKFNG